MVLTVLATRPVATIAVRACRSPGEKKKKSIAFDVPSRTSYLLKHKRGGPQGKAGLDIQGKTSRLTREQVQLGT